MVEREKLCRERDRGRRETKRYKERGRSGTLRDRGREKKKERAK